MSIGRRRSYVLRLTVQRSLPELEAEVAFVEEMRRVGFCRTPRFMKGKDSLAATTAHGFNMTAYHFIPGFRLDAVPANAVEPMCGMMKDLFYSLQRSRRRAAFGSRPTFPTPTRILGLFLKICRQPEYQETSKRYLSLLPLEEVAQLGWSGQNILIHSDLTLGNILWRRPNCVEAVIDFDDCSFGNLLIEFAGAVRGVCFLDEELSMRHFERLWSSVRDHLQDWNSQEIYAALVVSCLYYFVAINRRRRLRPDRPVNWRDANRAVALTEHRKRITAILGA